MMKEEKIKNSTELEFVIFCIEMLRSGWELMQNVFIRHLLKRAIF